MADKYRILLVDDEEEVRKSIIKKIDWPSAGFEVVGDAENGQDALEKIELLEPDLVLTDIRMPYMDGLTLAAKIRQIKPSIKIVIFSGFDDFEYAKQAISLNIIEYILKPVNAEELTAILVKIKKALDEEMAQLKDVNRLRESFIKSLPILRENFLNNLIRNRVEERQIQAKATEYNLNLGKGDCWCVCQISMEQQEGLSQEEEGLKMLSVKQLLTNHFNNRFVAEVFHSSQWLCAIVCVENSFRISEVISSLTELAKESRRILAQPLTIGIGQIVSTLSSIEESYRQAGEAIGYRAIEAVGDVIYIGDMEPGTKETLELDSKTEGDLVSAIKFGEKEKINSCAKEIAQRMFKARLHESQYQIYIISLLNVVLKIVQRYELDWEEMFGQKADFFQILREIRDAQALEEWIVVTATRVSENITDERQDSTKNMIKAAKKYIYENYSNSQLSLEMICNFLHISATYFSTIFKREVGESYTAYLTKIRLEKATELLSTTDEKTYLIAREVGYEEPNYFGYVFKKSFGVSPNKFRGK